MFILKYLSSMGNNFGALSDNLYRSAQPSFSRLGELYSIYGIRTIINLRDNLALEEYDECKAVGITLENYPMSDSLAPTSEQVDMILREILIWSKVSPTLFCCLGGKHRSSLIAACIRTRFQGWTKQRAWDDNSKYGWYSSPGGHRPLKDFFFNVFEP